MRRRLWGRAAFFGVGAALRYTYLSVIESEIRVVIIDDDEGVLDMLAAAVTAFGYHAFSAKNGTRFPSGSLTRLSFPQQKGRRHLHEFGGSANEAVSRSGEVGPA